MKSVITRTITGIFFIAFVVWAIMYNPISLWALLALITGVSLYEFYKILFKGEFTTMQYLMHNEVFRMNLLTRMSSRIERQYEASISLETTDIQDKIIKLIQRISYTPNWPKRLKIKMTTLAKLID